MNMINQLSNQPVSMSLEQTEHMHDESDHMVHDKFDLMHETLFLTVNLIDRLLAKPSVVRKKLQLVGLVVMQEKLMVNTLQFNMSVPTVYVFIKRFLKAAQADKRLLQLAYNCYFTANVLLQVAGPYLPQVWYLAKHVLLMLDTSLWRFVAQIASTQRNRVLDIDKCNANNPLVVDYITTEKTQKTFEAYSNWRDWLLVEVATTHDRRSARTLPSPCLHPRPDSPSLASTLAQSHLNRCLASLLPSPNRTLHPRSASPPSPTVPTLATLTPLVDLSHRAYPRRPHPPPSPPNSLNPQQHPRPPDRTPFRHPRRSRSSFANRCVWRSCCPLC
ncbi:hypothetical protein Fmac_002631 [Flemingia macrophylla]|uniref:B-like cyclin n=1 Tax=Flemingia macrophylla TaxID=520843 RepID=A0ABD1NL37_9FABA